MQAMLGLFARHGLTLLAGFLATKGVISPGETGALVEIGTSVVVGGGALVWSAVQKKKSGAM